MIDPHHPPLLAKKETMKINHKKNQTIRPLIWILLTIQPSSNQSISRLQTFPFLPLPIREQKGGKKGKHSAPISLQKITRYIKLERSNGPTLRANPFPKVTDLFCRIPLPTLFYRLEATHLEDLLRLSVRSILFY